jgi:hypothetical protein
LTVFNGSPRGKSGNTEMFLRHLLKGFESNGDNEHETFYFLIPVFKVFVRTKMANAYWDNQLKENGAYERRFARPYVE